VSAVTLVSLPDEFAATRDALHAVAEHVCAAARYAAEQRIGLQPSAGGFGTPSFGDDEQVRVDGITLVHRRDGHERRSPLTTLADAAAFVGVPLGLPATVYPAVTKADPDMVISVDAGAARILADWFAFGTDALAAVRGHYGAHAPTPTTLWPEHFDCAMELGDADAGTRANFGASPGDAAIPEPYLYVGPWDAARRTGALGAHDFGAARTYGELRATGDPGAAARAFFTEAADLLLA
jgi:hypothetical protein